MNDPRRKSRHHCPTFFSQLLMRRWRSFASPWKEEAKKERWNDERRLSTPTTVRYNDVDVVVVARDVDTMGENSFLLHHQVVDQPAVRPVSVSKQR